MIKLFRNILISVITWLILGCLIFMVYGKPLLPYNSKQKIDTGDALVAEDIMYDSPNIIFSAADYIKQARDTLWEKAGLQLYYVALYVPEGINTEEEMLKFIWSEIETNIYQGNGIYVCYSYYDVNNGDTREDFFINNYLMFGKDARKYFDGLFEYTYNHYYKSNLNLMYGGAWYTFPDCTALALKSSVESYTGWNLFGTINMVICLLIFCILNICTIYSYRLRKERDKIKDIVSLEDYVVDVIEEEEVIEKPDTALYLVETKDKREYK